MRRYFFSCLAAVLAAGSVFAGPITLEQAYARLAGNSPKRMAAKEQMSLVHMATTSGGQPTVYILNQPQQKGFVLLAADDTAAPLLGYSDSGEFNPNDIPEPMQWWLDEYARQIEFANSRGVAYEAPRLMQTREAIAPQIKTKWDQTPPFNNRCPLNGTERTYTGCVATTMAQVMNYWRYPEKGKGSITYTPPTLGKKYTLNFEGHTLDWDSMKDDYSFRDYTDAEADAVAVLMRDCGYSVKMDYSTVASAALALDIANAMVKYFDYDPNARYAVRALYSPAQWEDMIYNNLKNVGPIPYGGTSLLGGGHSFVCDGYDGAGYFHFNWGWSGASDGYFMLDAISPAVLGTGGGMGGGYCFSQDAVLGLQPPTGAAAENRPVEIVQAGSLTAKVEGTELRFGLGSEESATWLNYNPKTLNVLFGAKFEQQGGTDAVTAPIDYGSVTLKPGYGTDLTVFVPKIDLSALSLADGTYKVTFVANVAEDTDNDWLPVHPFYTYYNYVTLVKQGEKYTVKENDVPTLRVVDGNINGNLYYGGIAQTSIRVENPTDIDLTRGFAPALYCYDNNTGDYELFFIGNSVYLTVPAGTTKEMAWDTELALMVQGVTGLNREVEMKLTFFDESTYSFYNDDIFKTVVMKPNQGLPTVRVSNMVIEGASVVKERVNGRLASVNVINDKNNIPVSYTATLSGTVPFCYQMIATVLGSTPESDGSYAIHTFNGCPAVIEPGDNPYQFNTTLAFPAMEENTYYILFSAFLYGQSFMQLDSTGGPQLLFRLERTTGIDSLEQGAADGKLGSIYNLQGICVGTDWDSLPAGLYIRNGKKIFKK